MSGRDVAAVRRWNEAYPVGTPVVVTRDNGDELRTTTKSIAWVICGHASVMVVGISGGYSLARVRPAGGA